ncbi:hypothetical protein QYF36_021075 [Acer negundo]|nr:hypothetical protein QYF36_021075 [Acer negundo]
MGSLPYGGFRSYEKNSPWCRLMVLKGRGEIEMVTPLGDVATRVKVRIEEDEDGKGQVAYAHSLTWSLNPERLNRTNRHHSSLLSHGNHKSNKRRSEKSRTPRMRALKNPVLGVTAQESPKVTTMTLSRIRPLGKHLYLDKELEGTHNVIMDDVEKLK